MRAFVRRHPNPIQLPLVTVGAVLTLFYARQLPTLVPPVASLPTRAVSATLYDWSTVQFGLALVVLGVALSDRSVLHRLRPLRLSRPQRLVALGCALALASPWVTALVAGPVLGFREPYSALWSAAFLAGFAGVAGLALVGAWRLADLSLRSTEQFPHVEVDLSRREALRGGALAVVAGGTVTGTLALGRGPLSESRPAYLGHGSIVYERDDLRVQPVRTSARLGESLTFEATNTGDGDVVLGCHVPWALQAYEDGRWHHVTWTEGRYYLQCATLLGPGDSTEVTVPLSTESIADSESLTDPDRSLAAGTYRLVLLGTNPHLAVNFQILPAQ